MDDNSEKLVDSSVQQQEAVSPHSASEDQNHCENGQSPPHSTSKDVKPTDNQDSPHENSVADAGLSKELENNSDGDDAPVGNQLESDAPQPPVKAEDSGRAEMKNEINDTEVLRLPMRT